MVERNMCNADMRGIDVLPGSKSTSRRGKFLLKRKTRRDRMQAKLRETKEELRRRRHLSIPEQDNGSGRSSRASTPITPCR